MISSQTIAHDLYFDIPNFTTLSEKIFRLEMEKFRLQVEVEYLKNSLDMYKELYQYRVEIGHGQQ